MPIDPVDFYHRSRSYFAACDAANLLTLVAAHKPELSVAIVFSDVGQHPWSTKWCLDRSGLSTFTFPRAGMTVDMASIFAARWSSMFDVFVACQTLGRIGSCDLHLGDGSEEPGLNFCCRTRPEALIPDSDFLASRAYETLQAAWRDPKPWSERMDLLLWRGSSTGIRSSSDVRSLPRVRLCLLAQADTLLDCRITSFYQISAEEAKELKAEGLSGDFVAQGDYDHYRYHVDIDGNTSAWSSLFSKLLSGGVVFKVASPAGYKQWYYEKLVPWHNFVPVKEDLSDLASNLHIIRNDPVLAREIAYRGRELALSLTYDSQIDFARDRSIACLGSELRESEMPEASITKNGSPNSSLLASLLDNAIVRGLSDDGKLPNEVLSMEGMSGRRYRLTINNLIASVPEARYLEVGSWAGSTSCSAMHGNRVRAICIDNWSEFGGPKDQFLDNTSRLKGPYADFQFIESDFRAAPFLEIGRSNVYLFDGPHEEKDQYDGLAVALPALDERFVFIVDDWNSDYVRRGTLAAIAANGLNIEFSTEIRTTLDNSHPDICRQHSEWHNGYFMGVLRKRKYT